MKSWAKSNPVTAFIVIAFGIPWIGWTLRGLIAVDESLTGGGWDTLSLILFFTGCGPLVAGFVLSHVFEGRAGVKKLAMRMIQWRAPLVWWGLVLTLPFIVFSITAFILSTVYDIPLGSWQPWHIWRLVTPSVLLIFTIGPLLEEAGWRGFLLPRLIESQSPLAASLIIGALWTFWHFPLSFSNETYELFNSPLETVHYFIFVLCLSVLMTAIWLRTGGSLLLVMMFHWTVNAKIPVGQGLFPDATPEALDQIRELPLRFPVELGLWLLVVVIVVAVMSGAFRFQGGKNRV